MSSVRTRKWHQDLEALLRGGTLEALGDDQLLEVFLGPRGEAGQQAFSTLVDRHGPMVYRVCGQVLRDSHEAQDAFQAVFLILARKAGSVRNRESLGSWLHGVSLRVAARVRKGLNRRRTRELLAEDRDDVIRERRVEHTKQCGDAEAVHQEVGRLAEKYRAPIVLCYLEGLTHDQAATRLNCPVGTVRSRLARGRDQLRQRLVRRGVTVPVVLSPLAGWLGFEVRGVVDAAMMTATSASVVPADLLAITLRSVSQMTDGKAATVALFSSTAFTLTRGVLQTMAIERITSLAWTVLPAGVLVVATGLVVGHEPARNQNSQGAGGAGQETKGAVAPNTVEPPRPEPPVPVNPADRIEIERLRNVYKVPEPPEPVDPLVRQLFASSRQRMDAQRAYYEEGRITLDRMVMASQRLMEVERMVARKDSEVLSAMQRHLGRLQEMEKREQAELKAGRGTMADVSEIVQNRVEAELKLKQAKEARPAPDVVALERRLGEVERKLDVLLKLQQEKKPASPD